MLEGNKIGKQFLSVSRQQVGDELDNAVHCSSLGNRWPFSYQTKHKVSAQAVSDKWK